MRRLTDRQRIDADSTRPVQINLMGDRTVLCVTQLCGRTAVSGGWGKLSGSPGLNSYAYCRACLGVKGQRIR